MAVNSTRSMNMELNEGMTDGKYRKNYPNTSAVPAGNLEATLGDKSTLHTDYGFAVAAESPVRYAAGTRVK